MKNNQSLKKKQMMTGDNLIIGVEKSTPIIFIFKGK